MKFKRLLPLVILLLSACGDDSVKDDGAEFQEPALQKISDAIRKSPDNADLYFERATILDGLEKDSLAMIDYEKAISLDSTRAEYYSAIGDMLFENKNLDGSLKWIQKALQLNPKDKKAHLKLAKAFFIYRRV